MNVRVCLSMMIAADDMNRIPTCSLYFNVFAILKEKKNIYTHTHTHNCLLFRLDLCVCMQANISRAKPFKRSDKERKARHFCYGGISFIDIVIFTRLIELNEHVYAVLFKSGNHAIFLFVPMLC